MPEPTIHCEFLMQVTAQLDSPQVLSGAPLGNRRILNVIGGSFFGNGFQGELLRGGADWVLLRGDGVAELDIRFTLRTQDAQLIYVRSGGIVDMSPQVSDRIRNGEDVDPSEYYFRTSPAFETGSEKYSRLNRLVAVGVGRRTTTGMVTDMFEVK